MAEAQLRDFLEGLKLGSYFQKFIDEGYDELDLVMSLSVEDLDELFEAVGMKKGHALKLRRAVRGRDLTRMPVGGVTPTQAEVVESRVDLSNPGSTNSGAASGGAAASGSGNDASGSNPVYTTISASGSITAPSPTGSGSGITGSTGGASPMMPTIMGGGDVVRLQILSTARCRDFQKVNYVGGGQNGMIMAVRCTRGGLDQHQQYALKLVFNFGMNTAAAHNSFENEFAILAQVPPHDNITRYWTQFMDEIPDYAMEHLPLMARQMAEYKDASGNPHRRKAQFLVIGFHPTTLQTHLQSVPRPLAFELLAKYACDIAGAMLHLHAIHIVHLDLKLDNILLSVADRCVVCDFGTAKRFSDAAMASTFIPGVAVGGNMMHLAPEVLNAFGRARHMAPVEAARMPIPYGATEVWALGCLIHEMATGQHPFPSYPPGQGGLGRLSYGDDDIPPLPTLYPDDFRRMVTQMLALDPSRRPQWPAVYQALQGYVAPQQQVAVAATAAGTASADTVNVSVKSLTGKVVMVTVAPSASVGEVCVAAARDMGLTADGMTLLYCGKPMDTSAAISSLELQAESVVFMVPQPAAPTPAPAPAPLPAVAASGAGASWGPAPSAPPPGFHSTADAGAVPVDDDEPEVQQERRTSTQMRLEASSGVADISSGVLAFGASSAMANVRPTPVVGCVQGKYYFELQVLSVDQPVQLQVGWSGAATFGGADEACGDSRDSWGLCCGRARKYHEGEPSNEFGVQLAAGQVLCCCYNADNGEVLYGLDGRYASPWGTAFRGAKLGMAGGLVPTVTLASNYGRVRMLMGNGYGDLRFGPPPGFEEFGSLYARGSVQAEPAPLPEPAWVGNEPPKQFSGQTAVKVAVHDAPARTDGVLDFVDLRTNGPSLDGTGDTFEARIYRRTKPGDLDHKELRLVATSTIKIDRSKDRSNLQRCPLAKPLAIMTGDLLGLYNPAGGLKLASHRPGPHRVFHASTSSASLPGETQTFAREPASASRMYGFRGGIRRAVTIDDVLLHRARSGGMQAMYAVPSGADAGAGEAQAATAVQVHTVCGTFDERGSKHRLCSTEKYSSLRVNNKALHSGKWYWEVRQDDGMSRCMQVGVGTSSMRGSSEPIKGVGDDGESVGWEADHKKRWFEGRSSTYMDRHTWRDGDVVSVALDLDAGTITLGRNGEMEPSPMFTGLAGQRGWYPAVSYGRNGICTLCFGEGCGDSLAHNPPPGFRPLADLYCGRATMATATGSASMTISDGLVRVRGVSKAGDWATVNGSYRFKANETYSTMRVNNRAMTSGKWYWECALDDVTSRSTQIGIATAQMTASKTSPMRGVGDDNESLAYDPDHKCKWFNRKRTDFTMGGISWSDGDVMCFALDLDAGVISVSKNGGTLHQMYSGIRGNRGWYPAFSAKANGRIAFLFGGECDAPTCHTPPAGFQRLAELYKLGDASPPPATAAAAAGASHPVRGVSKAGDWTTVDAPYRFKSKETYSTMRVNNRAMTSGKWYWECKLIDATSRSTQIGIATSSFTASKANPMRGVGDDKESLCYDLDNKCKWFNCKKVAFEMGGATWRDGDTLCFTLDLDAGVISLAKNGGARFQMFSGIAGSRGWYPAFSAKANGQIAFQFGPQCGKQTEYAPPSGFARLADLYAGGTAAPAAATGGAASGVTVRGVSKAGGWTSVQASHRFKATEGYSTMRLNNAPMTSGKWYWECKLFDATSRATQIGIGTTQMTGDASRGRGVGDDTESVAFSIDSKGKWHNARKTDFMSGTSWSDGDSLCFSYDADSGALYLSKNGGARSQMYTGIRGSRGWYPAFSSRANGQIGFMVGSECGAPTSFAPPAGFQPLARLYAGGAAAASGASTTLVGLRVGGTFERPAMHTFKAVGGWSTMRLNNLAMTRGKWYWEVKQDDVRGRYAQIGIATARMVQSGSNGCGDDRESYAWDMDRQQRWHGGSHGKYMNNWSWSDGDVLSISFDADAGTLRFGRAGSMASSTAFTGISASQNGGWHPALSMGANGRVTFNLGAGCGEPLAHSPPAGFRPLADLYCGRA